MPRAITVRQAVAGAVAVILLSVGASVASAGIAQTFTDVSPSNPFYDEIEAIAAAGITEGYPDGTFRPGANITRQAMAAFMARGFGRVAYDQTPAPIDFVESDGLIDVATVTLEAGAVGAGGGYVVLSGALTVATQSTADAQTCPCIMEAAIYQDGVAGSSLTPNAELAPRPSPPAGPPATTTMAVEWVVPIAAGASETYVLSIFNQTNTGLDEGAFSVSGSLTATYVPFPGIPQPAPPAD